MGDCWNDEVEGEVGGIVYGDGVGEGGVWGSMGSLFGGGEGMRLSGERKCDLIGEEDGVDWGFLGGIDRIGGEGIGEGVKGWGRWREEVGRGICWG